MSRLVVMSRDVVAWVFVFGGELMLSASDVKSLTRLTDVCRVTVITRNPVDSTLSVVWAVAVFDFGQYASQSRSRSVRYPDVVCLENPSDILRGTSDVRQRYIGGGQCVRVRVFGSRSVRVTVNKFVAVIVLVKNSL